MKRSREEAQATYRKMCSMSQEQKDAAARELLTGVAPIIKAHKDQQKKIVTQKN
jgi:hypothetical protein